MVPKSTLVLGILCASLSSLAAWKNDPNCGIKGAANLNFDRIFNGEDAAPHEFPWMVQMQIKRDGNWSHQCGGSIINKRWILTAAHCVRNVLLDKAKFVLAAHNITNHSEPTLVVKAEKFIVYPEYETNDDGDVALIKLKQDLDLTNKSLHIGSICLPPAGEELDKRVGLNCTASGWGFLSDDPRIPATILQKVNLTIQSQEDCKREWPSDKITNRYICATGAPISDVCGGDSGSPLVCHIDGKWYQYGAVSGGAECIKPTKTGVYARITELMPWIERTVRENS